MRKAKELCQQFAIFLLAMGLLATSGHAAGRQCVPAVKAFPGFPVQLPNLGGVMVSNPVTSANVADLNGNGKREIVLGRADNTLYVFDATGNNLPGFPINLGGIPGWGISGEPLLYDLDNDGAREIIFATNGLPPGVNTTYLQVYEHTAVANALWPVGGVNIGTNSMYAPVGVDLEQLGRRSVLVDSSKIGVGYFMNGFRSNGVPAYGFPIPLTPNATPSSPSVADVLPGTNGTEVFFGGEIQSMHGVDYQGNTLVGWPAVAHPARTPALGDVDGDGDIDVVTVMPFTVGKPGGVIVYDGSGAVLPGWPQSDPVVTSFVYSSPSLADLDGDGLPEIILYIHEPLTPAGGSIHVWHGDGTPMAGWPQPMEPVSGIETNVTVADVDHDGRLEVVALGTLNLQSKLYVFNADGSLQTGFPYWLPAGSQSWATPTLADLNGDGKLEIVFTWFKNEAVPALSYAQLEVLQIRDCSQHGVPDELAWPQLKHDAEHSGFF